MACMKLQSTANERLILIRVQMVTKALQSNPPNLGSLFQIRVQPPALPRPDIPPSPLYP